MLIAIAAVPWSLFFLQPDLGTALVFGAISLGMTIGLAPVTGIPLPWMSYGRSALITNFLALGIVESVASHRHRLKFRD